MSCINEDLKGSWYPFWAFFPTSAGALVSVIDSQKTDTDWHPKTYSLLQQDLSQYKGLTQGNFD